MPGPVIANTARVVYDWNHPDVGLAKNILHFAGGLGYPDHDDLATALNANIQSGQYNSVAEDGAVETYTIQDLDGSAAATIHTGGPGGGAAGDDPVPALCCLVSLRTALAGKSFRGRIYLPYTAEVSTANGRITSDVAGMQSAWEDWIPAMEADGFTFVVASYKLEVATVVTSLLVETDAATQRRRQTRVRT